MGKPFRVKRGTRYVGSWKARVGGEIINLQTKDAEVARDRERRARRGDFGWRGDAADEVKEVLDGDGGDPPDAEQASVEEGSQGVASSEPSAAGPESGPIPAADGPPSEPPPPPAAGIDPVAAANEVAAASVFDAGDLKATVESMGVDLSSLLEPETLGGLHVAGQGLLFQVLAPLVTERKPKPLELPEKFQPAVKILGQAWRAQLQRWNVSLDGISPGSLILLASAGMLAAQIVALYAKEEEPAPAPSGVV